MHTLTLLLIAAACTPKDATWRYDTAPPVETDTDTDTDADTDEEGDYGAVLWGDYEGDEGWTGYWLYDPDNGGERCDME